MEIFGLIVLIADIYAIYKILTSGASGVAKLLWTLGVIIFLLGLVSEQISALRFERNDPARQRGGDPGD